VICIGNVIAGGAGKTPIALAVAKMLIKMHKDLVFLSRGYSGNLNVTTFVNKNNHSAKQVGDEPLLLSDVAPTVISRSKVAGVKLICQKKIDVIIMDDGLQNPTLTKDLSLLVIDGNYGIGNGCIIPAGPMRETLSAALKKTNAVIFVGEDKTGLLPSLKNASVIRAKIVTNLSAAKNEKYIAFAGIGNPSKFFQTLKDNNYQVIAEFSFPDHYHYTNKDILMLNSKATDLRAQLITTEKDLVRLTASQKTNITALPIEIEFEDIKQIKKLLENL
jgi:tetraacyldisaccharide 4'-kinase